ncbi:MAG TPA: hypothetical protein PKM41_02505 [Deltaproteobacteria bacterium]|jgi:phosphoheptose isomerase|nr:hypothetical protein [Deltaproteobacteria bacterium]HOI05887.1 hypothetical protein [Deltaproteobacteria bacterium]
MNSTIMTSELDGEHFLEEITPRFSLGRDDFEHIMTDGTYA